MRNLRKKVEFPKPSKLFQKHMTRTACLKTSILPKVIVPAPSYTNFQIKFDLLWIQLQ